MKEKRYRQIWFPLWAMEIRLFRGLSECLANRNIIFRLYRFSFHKPIKSRLVRDAYTCPIYAINCTTKSAIYVMELSEFHLWVLPLVFWIDGFSQSGYCMPHSLGLIKNRTDLFSGFWERPVLRKQTLRFQKTMSIGFWNHDGCFLSTAASDNKRKRSWKQTVLFFIVLYTLLACNWHNLRKSVTPPVSGSS